MYKLSPSDFAYLFEECKLCYYLKVKHGIERPAGIFPAVFGAINSRLQGNLVGKELRTLSSDLPEGIVVDQEVYAESKPIPGTSIYIKGRYDLLIQNSDGTHTLVDLKISKPDDEKIEKYKTQLGAYKFALENPANGKPIKITKLGLLIFYPDRVKFEDGDALLSFPPKWLDVPINDKEFLDFMKSIDDLLTGPTPAESKTCKYCQYRHMGDELSHITFEDN